MVESLKRFRIYLTGIPVKVTTDWLTIQEFDLDIEYRPGERMNVDALSRNPMSSHVLLIDNSDWLRTLQMQDENIQSILTQLLEPNASPNVASNYVAKNEVLYRNISMRTVRYS